MESKDWAKSILATDSLPSPWCLVQRQPKRPQAQSPSLGLDSSPVHLTAQGLALNRREKWWRDKSKAVFGIEASSLGGA